jgi:hypothetical protein
MSGVPQNNATGDALTWLEPSGRPPEPDIKTAYGHLGRLQMHLRGRHRSHPNADPLGGEAVHIYPARSIQSVTHLLLAASSVPPASNSSGGRNKTEANHGVCGTHFTATVPGQLASSVRCSEQSVSTKSGARCNWCLPSGSLNTRFPAAVACEKAKHGGDWRREKSRKGDKIWA